MENGKLGQEPAFPTNDDQYGNIGTHTEGISKRFYAACAAMQGILSSHKEGLYCDRQEAIPDIGLKERYTLNSKYLAEVSYRIADELLKQENL